MRWSVRSWIAETTPALKLVLMIDPSGKLAMGQLLLRWESARSVSLGISQLDLSVKLIPARARANEGINS